ncbi:MAG: biotin/lipoyl-containing protein, partial [Leifsonia flava]
IRIDSGITDGSEVSPHYDPMLAKVIALGSDRAEALARLDAALADTVVLGVDTNIAFLRGLIAEPAVQAGDLDTGLIDRMPSLSLPVPSPELLTEVAAALGATDRQQPGSASPLWRSRSGFRLGAPRPRTLTFLVNEALVEVEVAPQAGFDTRATPSGATRPAESGDPLRRSRPTIATQGPHVWVHSDGAAHELTVLDRAASLERSLAAIDRVGKAHSPELRAPMPGTVVAVHVADGDEVEAGQTIVSIEAMKMEHRITTPISGRVTLTTSEGALVRRDDVVASVTPIATSEKRDT